MAQFTRIGSRIVAVAAGCAVMFMTARMAMPANAVSQTSNVSSAGAFDVIAIDDERATLAVVSNDRGQGVTLSVPATAIIRVDEDGRVVAAMTNTGSAPTISDDIWLMHTDGSMEHAALGQFASQEWLGDFSEAGVYVDQDL